ncbi:MotA/TolQ/ExbB proton channel family protein [Pollutimonas bauzanensis]|uniref:Outer membrane transport energization protein ExbB (TC 2.C.1.1.1) n=1 Tax=Pollutimonas bauzanensis TaxID=658167 RepID=A0A1M5W436_9BURK|nr:MotA/TolQ/ExbB proton channel family protein [Pollutimonas bauzanensis]SHH81963.1 outer membrane transport energization protein ExbB (TC 2.C.1.1.1) [Pollutimonas bauzanensis]
MDLKHILEQVSQLLFYPVLVLLVVLIVWMLIAFGMFVRSALGRWRGSRPAVTRYTGQINAAAAHASNHLDIRIEQVLAQAEHASLRSLNAVRFAVRAGPSLGLMGTLIPMAAALDGLARGDLPALADHMVVAFSATIVGIAIGVFAHVIAMIREGWQREDLDAVRLHAERVLRAHEPAGPEGSGS